MTAYVERLRAHRERAEREFHALRTVESVFEELGEERWRELVGAVLVLGELVPGGLDLVLEGPEAEERAATDSAPAAPKAGPAPPAGAEPPPRTSPVETSAGAALPPAPVVALPALSAGLQQLRSQILVSISESGAASIPELVERLAPVLNGYAREHVTDLVARLMNEQILERGERDKKRAGAPYLYDLRGPDDPASGSSPRDRVFAVLKQGSATVREAAEGAGISEALAAHHLRGLVADSLVRRVGTRGTHGARVYEAVG